MFQAIVNGLFIDRQTAEPVILLQEKDGSKRLPIWVRFNEMVALAIEISQKELQPRRPFSHDLTQHILESLDSVVTRAVIDRLEDHIYRAKLFFEAKANLLEIDSRPSDAVIMALKFDAPIFVHEAVIEEHLHLTKSSENSPEELYERFQQVKPEDISGLSAG